MDIPTLEFRLPWSLKVEGESLEEIDLLADGAHSDYVVGRTRDGIEGEACFLAKVAEIGAFGKKLWMDLRGAHAIYIVGKRRSGKTHTLGLLCEGLTGGSWTTQLVERQAVVVFDTMNVFITAGRKAAPAATDLDWQLPDMEPRVHLFRPRSTPNIPGANASEIHLGGQDLTGEEWLHMFGIDPFTDVLGHLIREAYDCVRFSGYRTKMGFVEAVPRFGLGELERCVRDADELAVFRDETRQAAIRRFRALSTSSIFSTRGLDLAEILQPGVVSVLLLRDLPSEARELFVAILVRRIIEARSATEHRDRLAQSGVTQEPADVSRVPRCWLLIDEAHNYIPNGRAAISKRPLKRLIDEGRNLGISVVAATQQPSGLDGSIRRNADLVFIHSMSMEEDIRAVSGMLSAPWPKSTFVMKRDTKRHSDFFSTVRSLPRGYALVSSETFPRVVAVRMRPRMTESGDSGY
jgi:uncharacterized protein